ncbi:MAG: ABC transporter substrate-binding protein [Anaerolineales bacterium]|nr:ABC transporter substrate-binding protein [Anaerolineales bacterium]
MSRLYVGIDDTDILDSPGTGHLAREIAATLAERWPLIGITRHQLLNDPRVPMTARNSANVIHLKVGANALDLNHVADEVAALMLARFQPGSDPGLCVALDLPLPAIEFGYRTKTTLVTQEEARRLADTHQLILRALGGTGGGIIGALAATALASTGEDGRFISVGQIRELRGIQPVEAITAAGISGVRTLAGQVVSSGFIETDDKIRPALIGGEAVLLVEPAGQQWRAIRRD